MRQIIFATTNLDKVREISQILGADIANVKTMREIGFTGEVEEDGTTFQENAAIKAKAIMDFIQAKKPEYRDAIVMADDSGLEIDYYDKKPGVYSHRWLGERTYRQAMEDIIEEMKDVPSEKRTTRFVCAMAAFFLKENGEMDKRIVQETVEGLVHHEIIGENGFGYDPFFFVPEFGCTTAQMPTEQKNEISHRGKALRSMLKELEPFLTGDKNENTNCE